MNDHSPDRIAHGDEREFGHYYLLSVNIPCDNVTTFGFEALIALEDFERKRDSGKELIMERAPTTMEDGEDCSPSDSVGGSIVQDQIRRTDLYSAQSSHEHESPSLDRRKRPMPSRSCFNTS